MVVPGGVAAHGRKAMIKFLPSGMMQEKEEGANDDIDLFHRDFPGDEIQTYGIFIYRREKQKPAAGNES
jgi:hypothetical protein